MRQVIIYRSIRDFPITGLEFDRINDLSDANIFFTVIDSQEVVDRAGWFIAEPISETKQKIYKSLPADASLDQVIAILLSIKRGDSGPDKKYTPGNNPAKDEDIILDLQSNGGEYKGLFPVIKIANAPAWLVDLLNTLTGHGKLSLYLWLAITAVVGSKMAMNKKRSAICWIVLIGCAKMTYDAYRYRQQSQNKTT